MNFSQHLHVAVITDPAKIAAFEERALADGFLPCVANSRDLESLAPVPEPGTLSAMLQAGTLLLRRQPGKRSA